MKKYITFICCMLLCGCSQPYENMKSLECENFSQKHIIRVQSEISGHKQMIDEIRNIIGDKSICGWINTQIHQYCNLGIISHQKIQGTQHISQISNKELVLLLGSGGKWKYDNNVISFSQKKNSGKRSKNSCYIKTPQQTTTIGTQTGVSFIKSHRKGLKLYIKNDKSRYIDLSIEK